MVSNTHKIDFSLTCRKSSREKYDTVLYHRHIPDKKNNVENNLTVRLQLSADSRIRQCSHSIHVRRGVAETLATETASDLVDVVLLCNLSLYISHISLISRSVRLSIMVVDPDITVVGGSFCIGISVNYLWLLFHLSVSNIKIIFFMLYPLLSIVAY